MREDRIPRADIEALSSWILGKIEAMDGIVGGDIIYSTGRATSLSFRDGEPEEDSSGGSAGIGIRMIDPVGRQGVAGSNDLSRSAIEEVLEWSRANCLASEPESDIMLSDAPISDDASSLMLYDESIDDGISHEWRSDICAEMTREAMAFDPRICSVRSASWSDAVSENFYASTAGISGWTLVTCASCGIAVVATDGDSYEMASHGEIAPRVRDILPDRSPLLATRNALALIGGAPVDTGAWTLILGPEIAASIVGGIGDMFCASDVHRGRSMMAGKLGMQVASPMFTLIDDARLPGRMGSRMFDSEGVETGRTILIGEGKAKNYLYDLQYAARDGRRSTGSAVRGKASLPDISPSNLYLKPGSGTFESLMSGIDRGIWIRELMGLHTIDSVTGEFSLGAKGTLIEHGREAGPVAGITIAGTLTDLLMKITAVGSDLEFFGSTGSPSIVVEDIAIAGR